MKKNYVFVGGTDGYFYCVSVKDLLTTDPATVTVESDVKFKYGLSTYEGKVLSDFDTESNILQMMKEKKRDLKKEAKKESSFHEERPRKVVLKQREKMLEKAAAVQKPDPKSRKDKMKEKTVIKKKREVAAIAMEKKCIDSNPTSDIPTVSSPPVVNDGNRSASESECSTKSVSSDSSVTTGDTAVVKKCMGKDLQTLRKLNNSESESDNVTFSAPEMLKRHFAFSAGAGSSTHAPESKPSQSDSANGKQNDPASVKLESDMKLVQEDRNSSSGESQQNRKRKRTPSSASNSSEDDHERKKRKKKQHKKVSKKKKKKHSKKKSKKAKKVKQNKAIYKTRSENYLYNKDSPGVVQLHSKYDVYVQESDLQRALLSKSALMFLRTMVDKVYTKDALSNATPKGYPPRGKGKKNYQSEDVLPRLHPDGFLALEAKMKDLEDEKKEWRPRTTQSSRDNAFSNRVCSFKSRECSSSSSSSSSSSESSDSSASDS